MLTEHGRALADVELFAREEREFTITDGTEVQGWLVRDPDATGPQPLLLDIHGGPHNAWNAAADEMHLYHQELAARGWAVLLVNPRGSDGYGEAFYDGVLGAWGVGGRATTSSSRSTQLVAEGLADPERLAVTGYSYGGFMTCYLTGHDDRFAAAVAGGVVSDLVSMGGTCDDGHFLGALRARRRAVGRRATGTRRCRRSPRVDDVRHADAGLPRRGRRTLPGRPGPAVAHGAARARRPDPAGALPGRLARVHPRRAARRTGSTSTAGSSTGSSSTPARRRARRGSTPRTGSTASPTLAERHHVPGAAARHPARAARSARTSSSRRRTAS